MVIEYFDILCTGETGFEKFSFFSKDFFFYKVAGLLKSSSVFFLMPHDRMLLKDN